MNDVEKYENGKLYISLELLRGMYEFGKLTKSEIVCLTTIFTNEYGVRTLCVGVDITMTCMKTSIMDDNILQSSYVYSMSDLRGIVENSLLMSDEEMILYTDKFKPNSNDISMNRILYEIKCALEKIFCYTNHPNRYQLIPEHRDNFLAIYSKLKANDGNAFHYITPKNNNENIGFSLPMYAGMLPTVKADKIDICLYKEPDPHSCKFIAEFKVSTKKSKVITGYSVWFRFLNLI